MNIIGLITTLFLHAASADQLTLHFVPSPTGVNWKSPQALAYSVVKNQVAKVNGGERHDIGHVYVELECGNHTTYTGMTSVGNAEERNAIFKEGYGLGVLFRTFQGMLDKNKESAEDIHAMQSTGRSSFARFLISRPTCARLIQYIVEFKDLHYDQIYAGLNARPLKREGSGCSAFGASFLELAGLQHSVFVKNWMNAVVVPFKFIGGPMTGAHVSLVSLITAFNQPWETDPALGYPTHFWDPEAMNLWTRKLVKDLLDGKPSPLPWPTKSVISVISPGVEFDTTNVATPKGSFFQN